MTRDAPSNDTKCKWLDDTKCKWPSAGAFSVAEEKWTRTAWCDTAVKCVIAPYFRFDAWETIQVGRGRSAEADRG